MTSTIAVLACALVACGAPSPSPPVKVIAAPPVDAAPPAAKLPPEPPQVPPGARLPAGVVPLAYDVRLEVDPERTTFAGTVAIRVRLDAPASHVWLHALELDLEGGRYRSGERSGDLAIGGIAHNTNGLRSLSFGATLPAGEVTLELRYTGRVNAASEGLFREQTGGRWYLFAQSEAMFARRILPCFDEPSAKAAWKVTLVVPKGLVALANGALASEQAGPTEGTVEATFTEVAAMASYVFSIAVGPFELVRGGTVGMNKVPLRVAVARGDTARAATAIAKTGPVVDALERYFGAPLPLAKLDLVSVPQLFGAMENVGLITFDAGALVGDATDGAFVRRFLRFIAHELAHQWFGNSVTPAWWDDLWLSEGLSTWMGDKISLDLGAFDDPTLRTQLARERALHADAEVDARPLRRAIASTDDPDVRFDAIAYEKGSAVLAMFERFAGPAAFQTAVRAYLAKHAGGTATASDFASALASVRPALGPALAQYLERPGTPVVEIGARCAGGTAVVEARARDGAAVPVCVRTPEGEACALVTDRTAIAQRACPAWIVGNAGGRGYYRTVERVAVVDDDVKRKKSAVPAPAPHTGAEKLARAADLATAVAIGELPASSALAELHALTVSRDAFDRLAALEIALAINPLVPDATRDAWSAWLAARFRDRTYAARVYFPDTPIDGELRDKLLRVLPADRYDRSVIPVGRAAIDRILNAPDRVPTLGFDLGLIFLGARDQPAADVTRLFDRVVAAAAASKDDGLRQQQLLESLGLFGADLAPRVVELIADPRFRAPRVWAAISTMLARPTTRTAAWQAVRTRIPELLARLPVAQGKRVIEAASHLCDQRADVAAAFAPHIDRVIDGPTHLSRALAAIDRCTSRRAALGDLFPHLK